MTRAMAPRHGTANSFAASVLLVVGSAVMVLHSTRIQPRLSQAPIRSTLTGNPSLNRFFSNPSTRSRNAFRKCSSAFSSSGNDDGILRAPPTPPVMPTGVWKAPDEYKDSVFTSKKKGLEELNVNDVLKGRIVGLKPFGAWIDCGFVKDGLLPSRELKKKFGANTPEFGTELDVRVLEVDQDLKRFRLGIMQEGRRLTCDFSEGDIIEGTVKSITSFGVFIDIGAGKDGLLHMSWLRNEAFKEGMVPGEKVTVKVNRIDYEKSKIMLGAPNLPQKQPEERRSYGNQDFSDYKNAINNQLFTATVKSIKPYGAILELPDGIRGLLPLRFASATRIESVNEVMEVGDKVDVYVLGIDDRGISFTTRQLASNARPEKPKPEKAESPPAAKPPVEAVQASSSVDVAPTPPSAVESRKPPQDSTGKLEEDDDTVEVEERMYKGTVFLVNPETSEVYTEEGEVVGEWEGDEPIFY